MWAVARRWPPQKIVCVCVCHKYRTSHSSAIKKINSESSIFSSMAQPFRCVYSFRFLNIHFIYRKIYWPTSVIKYKYAVARPRWRCRRAANININAINKQMADSERRRRFNERRQWQWWCSALSNQMLKWKSNTQRQLMDALQYNKYLPFRFSFCMGATSVLPFQFNRHSNHLRRNCTRTLMSEWLCLLPSVHFDREPTATWSIPRFVAVTIFHFSRWCMRACHWRPRIHSAVSSQTQHIATRTSGNTNESVPLCALCVYFNLVVKWVETRR